MGSPSVRYGHKEQELFVDGGHGSISTSAYLVGIVAKATTLNIGGLDATVCTFRKFPGRSMVLGYAFATDIQSFNIDTLLMIMNLLVVFESSNH